MAWAPLGWHAAWLAEIDPFASAVLAHHYPLVPNLGDFTQIGRDDGDGGAIELLVGGTPCQDFSVAGQRGGLEGANGALALEFVALAGRLRPRWVVWENVPGVLSQNDGRDFGAILRALEQCGYGFAYRVLDAQYFGVPQRRRRVFLVGYLGDWRPPCAVLFERASLSGHPPPRREAGQRLADTLTERAGGHRLQREETYVVNGNSTPEVARGGACYGFHAQGGTHSLAVGADVSPTLKLGSGNAGYQVAVAFTNRGYDAGTSAERLRAGSQRRRPPSEGRHENQRGELRLMDAAANLSVGGGKPGQGYPAALTGTAVRRLTPLECERLQGLPDNWTLVPYRGKPATDTSRYRAIGNSMAVPVVRWIGERIALVEGAASS